MKTNGAVLWGLNEKWSVEEIELDPPQDGELLVEFEATGLCHSDHHIRTGDMFGVSFPLIGGHEGAGIVREVGPGGPRYERWETTWSRPSCRRAVAAAGAPPVVRTCVISGRRSSRGFRPTAPSGAEPGDGASARFHGVGSFAQWGMLSEASVVKIDDDVPLSRACLLGCGVTTGWGSAVNTANVSSRRRGRRDWLRRHRQRCHSGRAAGRRGADRRGRYRAEQARQGIPVRCHALRPPRWRKPPSSSARLRAESWPTRPSSRRACSKAR